MRQIWLFGERSFPITSFIIPFSPGMGRRCPKGGRGVVDAKLFVDVRHFVPDVLNSYSDINMNKRLDTL